MSKLHLLALGSIVLVACGGTVNEGTGGGGTGGSTPTSTSSSSECNCRAYQPVCGVDGQTHNAGCGDECVPVEIACRNECPCLSCDDLREAYIETIAEAKACNPLIDFNECNELVPDQLDCPCSTYINPGNQAALDTLADLRARFEANACSSGACPAVECEPAASAACVGDSESNGVCQDQFGR
jgi:hypothetical protein